jgi:transglutaminase-like putative cysteine protease
VHYHITHTTRYRYSRPVCLEPHELRLTPRTDAAQRLVACDLRVWPSPIGTASLLDAEGNVVTSVWWEGALSELTIESRASIETLRHNPFDYLLLVEAASLPVGYGEDLLPLLRAARDTRPACRESAAEIDKLVAKLRRATREQTTQFLMELTCYLHRTIHVMHRHDGPPKPPAITLADRQGACRDLAVLFIDACRAAGLASRFVSGYYEGDADHSNRELHAWAEVYLPGGGWRGFDPTLGLAVADRHAAVAASIRPQNTMPIIGTFRGDAATAEMTYSVSVSQSDASWQSQSPALY